MRNVHLEADSKGHLLNPNIFAAFDGFSRKAYDTHLFHLRCEPQSIEDIVCGTVGAVQRAWRHLGVTLPELLDYPAQLQPYLGREIWPGSLGDVRKALFAGDAAPVFVKPRLTHKLFTGQLMSTPRHLIESAHLDDSTAVWLSSPVSFRAEYRVFILQGEMVGAKHYHGDYAVLPDFARIRQAISDYSASPIAYSLDFGLTVDGQTLLVEANDSFALGNYGLDSFLYAQMIEARWDEVTGYKN